MLWPLNLESLSVNGLLEYLYLSVRGAPHRGDGSLARRRGPEGVWH